VIYIVAFIKIWATNGCSIAEMTFKDHLIIVNITVHWITFGFPPAFHCNCVYIVLFRRQSKILVENGEIFLPHVYMAPLMG